MSLKFSVITVVFNGQDVISKTILSVLNQESFPYEYIIIDGASSDETVKIAEKYKQEFKNKGIKYRIISEKDSGTYNAMNKAIKIANGEFLSFLNAGDWYEKNALRLVKEFYEEERFDLTYGGLHYIKKDGSVTIKMSKLDKYFITSRHWNHPSMFLRTEIYRKYYFDESLPAYGDFDLYLKLRKDGTKIRVIDKIIANFVADGYSTQVKFDRVIARGKEKYRAYSKNGYSKLYFIEAYGWEILKSLYLKLHS